MIPRALTQGLGSRFFGPSCPDLRWSPHSSHLHPSTERHHARGTVLYVPSLSCSSDATPTLVTTDSCDKSDSAPLSGSNDPPPYIVRRLVCGHRPPYTTIRQCSSSMTARYNVSVEPPGLTSILRTNESINYWGAPYDHLVIEVPDYRVVSMFHFQVILQF